MWRNETNQILYALISIPELTDQIASEMAAAMVDRRYFMEGAEAYAGSIRIALGQPTGLTDQIETPHSEADFRSFLHLVAQHLPHGQMQEND